MTSRSKAFFVLVPIVAAIALAIVSCLFSSRFAHSPGVAWFVALIVFGSLATAIISFLLHEIQAVHALGLLLVQGACAIATFAAIFHGYGLVGTKDLDGAPAWTDSFYFSIVTWTTLGYGDFTAPADIRLIAAMEAILGYICFGLIVGFIGASAATGPAER